MFENVDGQRTDAGVIRIQLAHLGAFGSGELKMVQILINILPTPILPIPSVPAHHSHIISDLLRIFQFCLLKNDDSFQI